MMEQPRNGDVPRPTNPEAPPAIPALERIRGVFWRWGVWTATTLRRAGLWGPVCRPLIWVGQLIIPPLSSEGLAELPLSGQLKIPPGWPSSRTLTSGLYEPELTELFFESVRESMTVVDVGANIGYYTILASRLVGDGGSVVAFEPDPDALVGLRHNVSHNHCTNVEIVEFAVAATPGQARLCVPQPEHGFLVHETGEATNGVVATTTLDQFFSDLDWPRVDIIKMDIEGGEESALAGMADLCRRNPGVKLFLELNIAAMARSGVTLEKLVDRLRRIGFVRARFIELDCEISLAEDRVPTPATHPQAMYNILCVQHVENA